MIEIAWVICYFFIGLSAASTLMGCSFARVLRRHERELLADDACPKVAVILCLRGADPFLAMCLQRLLNQEYPRYDVWVVIDHHKDPAWEVVQQVIHETGARNVQVHRLRQRRETCSLKNSALVQAVTDLDASYEIVAMVDADTLIHRQWLRALVTPLADERIGATYGNRWYAPPTRRWGSLVRYLWNAAAVVPAYYYEMPWGGTLALRLSTLHRAGIVDTWTRTSSADAPIRRALHALGLRLKFVPSLMMINREECNLTFCLHFIRRQLILTRLYHPWWSVIFCHALVTASAMAVAVVFVTVGLATGQMGVTAWAGGGLAVYWLTMLGLLIWLETGMQRIVQTRGETLTPFTLWRWAKVALGIPLAHGTHLVAVMMATFKHDITWRGVTYHIRGPWDVRMVNDHPFEYPSQAINPNSSL